MSVRPGPLTDMAWPLTTGLLVLALPRTVLADLAVIEPETGVYFLFALPPFAVWLAVALLRRTSRPVGDFLVLGALYGLSLLVIHQLLWNAAGAENSRPAGGDGLTARVVSCGIAMGIGLGVGAVLALVAWIARRVGQARRGRAPA